MGDELVLGSSVRMLGLPQGSRMNDVPGQASTCWVASSSSPGRRQRSKRSVTCSGQRPALAVLAADVGLGLGGIRVAEPLRVPLQLLAGAVGDIAQVVGLGQPARVVEVAERRCARLAGVELLGVVT